MKTTYATSLLLAAASNVVAFPHMMDKLLDPLARDALVKRIASPQGAGALPLVPPPFDAKAQYVSNQGDHKVFYPFT